MIRKRRRALRKKLKAILAPPNYHRHRNRVLYRDIANLGAAHLVPLLTMEELLELLGRD